MSTRQGGRSPRIGGAEDVVRVAAEIRNSIDLERQKRYAREVKQSEEAEEALAKLSKFIYQPVDYAAGLERKPWVEPAIPDFSYLMTEARLKVSEKYFVTIALQLAVGLFFVLLTFYFQDSFVAIVGIAGLAACAFALHRELYSRRREIERALEATKQTIEAKVKEIRESIDNARKEFEDAENNRIERIEKILAGEPAAVFERMEEVLHNIRMPFYLRCSLDYFDGEPLLTLLLPGHNIIPTNLATLTPAGNIEYEEKSPFDVNRQYTEALAGTALTISLLLLAYLPTVNVIHVRGLVDRGDEPDCLYSFSLGRENAEAVSEAGSGLEALRMLEANLEIGTNALFLPVTPVMPPWWTDAPRHAVRGTTMNFKMML
jgi:hypothetical protein